MIVVISSVFTNRHQSLLGLRDLWRESSCKSSVLTRNICTLFFTHTCTESIKITMNGNDHNNNNNSNLIINQLPMNLIFIDCWIMQFFNITLNDCSELS